MVLCALLKNALRCMDSSCRYTFNANEPVVNNCAPSERLTTLRTNATISNRDDSILRFGLIISSRSSICVDNVLSRHNSISCARLLR